MPKLTVLGYGTFDVPPDKRLVLAIEQDAKVDILHACGGNARCTTCRVEFVEGEPSRMTAAEQLVLTAEKQLATCNYRRCQEYLIGECVGGNHFKLLTHFQDDHVAVFGRQIEFAIRPYRGRFEVISFRQPRLRKVGLARGRIQSSEKPVVCHKVESVLVQYG